MALLLGIAFAVALLATAIFYSLISSRLESAQASTRVVVAAAALTPGLRIEERHLRTEALDHAPPGSFQDRGPIVGKTVKVAVPAGVPIESAALIATPKVPAGMRGISLRVADSSGLVEMIEPGSRVDVQVVASDRAHPEFRARTVATDLEVISVSPPAEGRPVVNLVITPEQADELALADSTARVRLLLRNSLDQAAARTQKP